MDDLKDLILSEENKSLAGKDNLESLLEKNLELSEEILALSKYIKKYVYWKKIMTWLKLFLILVPILLAFLYIPPFLKNILGATESLMEVPDSMGVSVDAIQELLK